ncbi:MAG TPA: protein translocase subunit SecD [Gammaproteobacteria bacterium]|nr:protein translocase subunit SecD [Gammaproteobacteria bacterium]
MIQNTNTLWRYLILGVVLSLGFLYALPNLFGFDPALQITARRSAPVDDALQSELEQTLADAGIALKSVERGDERLLFRFPDDATRTRALPVLENAVDATQYTVALNLAPGTPGWLRMLGGKPMYMGLDLRGGVHFLMQVDTEAVRKHTEERFISELRASLREQKIRFRTVSSAPGGGIRVNFLDGEARSAGLAAIKADYPDLQPTESANDETLLTLKPTEQYMSESRKTAIKQNLTTLRNRINEFGVAEPVIQQQGDSRIVVQLPGIEDTAEAKKLLGATATLEFRMVDIDGDVQAATQGKVPFGSKLYRQRSGEPVLLEKRVLLTGESIVDASSGIESQTGEPAVYITLDGKGARSFGRATRELIGKPMAVVFIEQQEGKPVEEVINVATIRDELGKRFQITGLDSTNEAADLALLLRAGALAAPMEIIEERTVGPSLGQANIDNGLRACIIGFAAVCLFMLAYYRAFGMIANVALALNVVLLVALLSMLQATLTLPGIAGILLTVGMAVDANVLINERIREELRRGMSPQASIQAGYDRAFGTILDSNLTTLIAGIVLFSFGSGPVKGFAVTLSLGIATSMFTAIVGTRAIVNLLYGGRRLRRLSV